MERQDHGEFVQYAGAQVVPGYGAHLAVPHRRHPEVARHPPGVTAMDRDPSLRERMVGLRGRLPLIAGILVAPFVVTSYLGLTVLLLLPLLGLRRMFPRRAMASRPGRGAMGAAAGMRHVVDPSPPGAR